MNGSDDSMHEGMDARGADDKLRDMSIKKYISKHQRRTLGYKI